MKTEPGAPVRAVADPVRIMPKPSPKNHTPKAQNNEMTIAGRTVGRKNRPTPMTNWMVAKRKFHTPTSGEMKWPAVVISHAIGSGCPPAFPVMKVGTNCLPNMNGWYWSAASIIQKTPRTICRTRCVPTRLTRLIRICPRRFAS